MQPVVAFTFAFAKTSIKKNLYKLLYYQEDVPVISLNLQFFELFLLVGVSDQH